jgi:hypothetical protein
VLRQFKGCSGTKSAMQPTNLCRYALSSGMPQQLTSLQHCALTTLRTECIHAAVQPLHRKPHLPAIHIYILEKMQGCWRHGPKVQTEVMRRHASATGWLNGWFAYYDLLQSATPVHNCCRQLMWLVQPTAPCASGQRCPRLASRC